ncbi:MAG: hypothetical protein NTZ98_10510 [Acidobacteria bacterium]|jgi:hypothetical protein|nr:hypothetical protein [Acidobacteriota bacterium]
MISKDFFQVRRLSSQFEMVTMPDTRRSVEVVGRSWKYPLPVPFAAGVRVLSGQRVREGHLPQPTLQTGFLAA